LELVRILDRVGAVASVEAHERLIKRVVKACETNGMQNELTPGAFRVVSVDNLDIFTKPCSGVRHFQSEVGMAHPSSVQSLNQTVTRLLHQPPMVLYLTHPMNPWHPSRTAVQPEVKAWSPLGRPLPCGPIV